MKKVRDWKRIATEAVADYRIFKLRRDVSRSPRTGNEHPFIVLEGCDWVNVIPVTESGNVVFIEQFRHGVRQTTLEVPGGMIDEGESPATAALRELEEETGYSGAGAEPLGVIHPNPAIQENRCHSFVVRAAKKVGEPRNESTEDIATVEIPLVEVPKLITEGRVTHALVVVAFTWLWLEDGFPS